MWFPAPTLTTPWGVLSGIAQSAFGFGPFPNTNDLYTSQTFPQCPGNGGGPTGTYLNFAFTCPQPDPNAWRCNIRAWVCPNGDIAPVGTFSPPTSSTPAIAYADRDGGTCDPVNIPFRVTALLYPVACASLGISLGTTLTLTP